MAKKKNNTTEYKIHHIKTDILVPYINNSRTHSTEQVKQIAASIKEFGFTNPVLIDDKNMIIAGHGRLQAAEKLNMDKVPCIILHGLTDAQKKAYVIADNKLALNAGWDEAMLANEIANLQELDYNIDLLGFSADEINEIVQAHAEPVTGLIDEDDIPDIPENPVTIEGDIWTLGNHRLMCGDSTDQGSVALLMDGQKADMVFTDPPYGMFLDTDFSSMQNNLKMMREKGIKNGKKYPKVIGDHEDFDPKLINCIFDNFSYCKEIFIFGADYFAELLPNKNDGCWVVWDKRLEESADKMYGSCFELCWSKARHKRMIARIKWAGAFGTQKEPEKKRVHPTQKPQALIQWFFDYYSLKNCKIVADLYGGSGSTMIAAEKNNRHSRLMELDPKYCDVIIKRWQDYTGKDAILTSNGKTFKEVADERG